MYFFIAQLTDGQRSDLFISLFGWFEDPHATHIAMEYIEHGDLSQYIKADMAKTEVREITSQILRGLVVLHGRGICHRDLKPQVRHQSDVQPATYPDNSTEHPNCIHLTDTGQNHRFRSFKTCGRNILKNWLWDRFLPSPRAAWITAQENGSEP